MAPGKQKCDILKGGRDGRKLMVYVHYYPRRERDRLDLICKRETGVKSPEVNKGVITLLTECLLSS